MPAGNGGRLFLCVSRRRGRETGLLPPEVWNPVSLVDTLFVTAGRYGTVPSRKENGVSHFRIPVRRGTADGVCGPPFQRGTPRKERI